jgi:hypothetical protein
MAAASFEASLRFLRESLEGARVEWGKHEGDAHPTKEQPMNTKPPIQIELTPEQRKQVEQLTGKPVSTVKLSLEALDERVAPSLLKN